MPSDLTATRVSPPVPSPVPGQASSGAAVAEPRPAPADRPAAPATPFPNPTLRLDAALSMVVIEFRDDSGGVRTSIPTAQQLAAYRSWDRSRIGEPPRGMPGVGEALPDPAPPAQAAGARDVPPTAPVPAAPAAAPGAANVPATGSGAPAMGAAPAAAPLAVAPLPVATGAAG